jgi:AcrR family transcriptional regulator
MLRMSGIAANFLPRRNKGFEETHRALIETAVRLISEKGVDSLSIAAIARAMRINRTTVYYHFESREALIEAVRLWSSEQLAKGLSLAAPQQERIDFITRFVLQNPELIKLWIDDFISTGDIRTRYPSWDALVQGIAATFAARMPDQTMDAPDQTMDAEVYCVILLAGAIIGPRVFKNSVEPTSDIESVVKRFRLEQQRLLGRDDLIE